MYIFFLGYLVSNVIADGRWWQFLYCSAINVLNLAVCLIGASMFAKTTVFILILVCTSLGITFFSFFYEGPLQVTKFFFYDVALKKLNLKINE